MAIVLAAGWLALALPIAGAAVVRLPGDAVLSDLRSGVPVGDADLARLAESRLGAGHWRADPRDAKVWALARLLLAEEIAESGADSGPDGDTQGGDTQGGDTQGGDTQRGDTQGAGLRLRAVEARLNAALAVAPADPYAWTRLALTRWRLERPAGEVLAALDAARRTGPHVGRLQAVGRALKARLAVPADG